MIEIFLPKVLDQRFMALIPEQRQQVNELMEAGTLLSYTLSADRDRLWVIMQGDSAASVQAVLDSFPIMPYSDADIHELMFHHAVSLALPKISLN